MTQVSYPRDKNQCHDQCMKLQDFTVITGGDKLERKTIPYKSAYDTGDPTNHTNDTTLTTVKLDMLKTIHINFTLSGHDTKIECSKFK